ncbi:MAG TPA: hypothetical protein VF190_08220 [Rhodothermales bacterium]
MKRFLTIVAFALLASIPASAQNTGDGTIYSRFGIGELRGFASPQIEALGGAGYSLQSLNYVNLENPASWGSQVLTRAVAGLRYQNLRARADGLEESVLSEGNLGVVQFSFPIVDQRAGIAAGLQPFSRVSYRVQLNGRTVPDPAVTDSVDYRIDFEGSGGLQQIVGGVGFQIVPSLSVGAGLHFIFGILDYGRQTSFPGSRLEPANLVTSTRMSGITGSFGALFRHQGLLGDADLLSVGATFRAPASLRARRVQKLGESLNVDTLAAPINGDVTLPLSVGFGASYQPDARWLITADALLEPWTSFESDLEFAGLSEGGAGALEDRLRLSGGVEFLPAGNDLMEPFLERIAYRLGAYYDRSYVTPLAGVSIGTVAVTGGFSFPTMLSGTRLDINFEAGTRGTTDHNLVRDVFYRVSLNVNVGERWFQKTRLR